MIDNPKLLWKNLRAKVRNCWIERYLFQSKCYQKLRPLIKDDTFKSYNSNVAVNSVQLKKKILSRLNNTQIRFDFGIFAKTYIREKIVGLEDCRG